MYSRSSNRPAKSSSSRIWNTSSRPSAKSEQRDTRRVFAHDSQRVFFSSFFFLSRQYNPLVWQLHWYDVTRFSLHALLTRSISLDQTPVDQAPLGSDMDSDEDDEEAYNLGEVSSDVEIEVGGDEAALDEDDDDDDVA